jgi:hypothetical protein
MKTADISFHLFISSLIAVAACQGRPSTSPITSSSQLLASQALAPQKKTLPAFTVSGVTSAALSADGTVLAVANVNYQDPSGIFDAAGEVLVYVQRNGHWQPNPATLLPPTSSDANLNFGQQISLSHDGRTLAVALDLGIEGVPTSTVASAVWIYSDDGSNTWDAQPIAILTDLGSPSNSMGSGFGNSLALSGDGATLIVGAPFYSATGDPDFHTPFSIPGAALVYHNGSSGWALTSVLTNSINDGADTSLDNLGMQAAASYDGSTLLAKTNDDVAFTFEDQAAFGTAMESTWNSMALTDNGLTLALPSSISIDGVSAQLVNVYSRQSSDVGWPGPQSLESPYRSNAQFGVGLSLSSNGSLNDSAPGPLLAVGDGAGNVYLYAQVNGLWTFETRVLGTASGFGSQVVLSSDGSTLVVTAPTAPESQANNPNTIGAAFVYSVPALTGRD